MDNNLKVKNYYTEPFTHSDTYEDEIQYLGTKYRNLQYSMPITYSAGGLLGTDKTLIYEAVDQGILSDMEIITCERQTYKLFQGYVWEPYTPTGTIGNALVDGVKRQIESSISDVMNKITIIDPNASYGYQVRCVKEKE